MSRCLTWAGILVAIAGCPANSQTRVDARTQTKSIDFSAASATKPFRMGGALPSGCSEGELFFLTAAQAGKNVYLCSAGGWSPSHSGIAGTAPSDGDTLLWNAGSEQWEPVRVIPAQAVAGEGLVMVGSVMSIDRLVVPVFASGAGVPGSACEQGELYFATDGNEMWFCAETNLWTKLSRAGHSHDASEVASGVLAAEQIPVIDASKVGSGTLDRARIPAPEASALGGVRTKQCDGSEAVREIAASGDVVCGPVSATGADPTETGLFQLDEEFAGGDGASGRIGTHGWSTATLGAAPAISLVSPGFPHPGAVRITTTSADAQGGAMFLPLSHTGYASLTGWNMVWVFKAGQSAGMRLRVGLIAANPASAETAHGVWLRCDSLAGFADATWKFEARASGVSTVVDSGAACDTGWHKLAMASTVAGMVRFVLDDGAGGKTQEISTNITATGTMYPGVVMVNQGGGGTKSLDIDKFAMKATGLVR